MVFEEIREIIMEQLELEKDDIERDSVLEDLGIDYLDLFDLAMSIEDEFGVVIPEEVMESFETVEDIVSFVEDN